MILVAVHICAGNCRNVERARHVLDDRIQHLLYALVPVSGTAAYRDSCTLDASLAESSLHFLHGRLLTLKVDHHEVLIKVADLLNEQGTVLLSLILILCRNRLYDDLCSVFTFIIICLHLEKIDNSLEFALGADRDLQTDRILSEACSDLIDRAVEVRADDVHLVDKRHTRNIVLVGLTPYVLGLRLDAALCVEHAYRAVKNAE